MLALAPSYTPVCMVHNRLRQQRDRQRISQRELAARSGVKQSTIAKIETGDQQLKLHHIKLFADALKVRPVDLLPIDLLDDALIQQETQEGEAEPYIPPANDSLNTPNRPIFIDNLLHNAPHCSAWVLKNTALDQQGYRAGDIFIMDETVKPKSGDIVCAQIYKGDEAETAFRIYHPPYLLTATQDDKKRDPIHIESRDVMIKGTVISTHRPLAKHLV